MYLGVLLIFFTYLFIIIIIILFLFGSKIKVGRETGNTPFVKFIYALLLGISNSCTMCANVFRYSLLNCIVCT